MSEQVTVPHGQPALDEWREKHVETMLELIFNEGWEAVRHYPHPEVIRLMQLTDQLLLSTSPLQIYALDALAKKQGYSISSTKVGIVRQLIDRFIAENRPQTGFWLPIIR